MNGEIFFKIFSVFCFFKVRLRNPFYNPIVKRKRKEKSFMKKLMKLVAILLIAIMALCTFACNNASTGNVGTGGFIYTGGDNASTAEVTYSSDEETIIGVVEETDLTEVSEDVTAPEDVSSVEETSEAYTITESGDYYLTGDYTGGITIAKGLTVHLYLENANISSDTGDAVSVKKDGSVTITVVEGSTNTITSGGKNGINSNSPVVINGSGTLYIVSTAKNGIKVDNSLTIVDATVNITSVNHGISAYNVTAADCTINVTTSNGGEAKDGIHAEMADPESEDEISDYVWTETDGFVILNNVNYTCDVEGDGIQADTFVYINGGTYDITTSAKFVSYSTANMTAYDLEKDDFRYRLSGGVYYKQASDAQVSSGSYAMIQSCKGIKVGEIDYEIEDSAGNVTAEGTVTSGNYYILIEGGTFTINSADDAIHVNSGSVTINGGTFTITTLDDGITADYLMKINGGNVTINYCYEGIEGSYVEINGGTISITSRDDGINAASDYNVTEYIKITGGNVYVNAYGDGIDSNGYIRIRGGTVFVDGPSDNGNGSIDCDPEFGFYADGGYVVAVGSSGWVSEATPKSGSAQYSLVYSGSNISAGTTLTLKDSSGNTVVSFTTAKSSSSVVISAPEITAGTTYTLYAGNSALATFSVTSKVTSVGTSSGGGQFGPGGNGGFNPGRR